MKRYSKYIIILTLLAGLLLGVFGCSGNTKTFTVEYFADVGGLISGVENQTVEKGKDADIVIAIPDDGYVFLKWSDGNINQVRQDKNVKKNISLTAYFVVDTNAQFTVTYSASENGQIIGKDAQIILYGNDADTIIAVPDIGYKFSQWSDGNTESVRQDKNVKKNSNLIAYFEIDTNAQLIVTYSAQEGGFITGQLEQTIIYGEDAQPVTAIPDIGYKFVKWSDGRTDLTRHDTEIKEIKTITAIFDFCLEDGSGTVQKPCMIETYQQLLDTRQYPNRYYKLATDLDLSNVDHTPLFNSVNAFDGIFDGDGYSIKNMRVNKYTQYPSLFGFIDIGSVKNLNIIDFEIVVPNFNTSVGTLNVGAIAGISMGELNNIYAKGIIKGNNLTYDGVAIGGLIGQSWGLIINCSTDVTIEINNVSSSPETLYPFNIGGLVGVGSANIISCQTQGNINISETHDELLVGGLIGYFMMDGSDDMLNKLEIRNCTTDIEIFNDVGSFAHSGGLIANVIVYEGIINIENCSVLGNISNGECIGGFINYASSHGSSKITILNSSVKNDIIINSLAAGFIYSISNDSNNGSIFEIANCYYMGNIVANGVGGFCYMVGTNVKFYRCYFMGDIQGMAMSAGFIFQMMGGTIEECFTIGTITLVYQGAGFVFYFTGEGYISSCYSTCDIFVTNTDPDVEWRTLISGFIYTIKNAYIENCYYGGEINGHVYTSSKVSGLGSIVGVFAGTVNNSHISNCHIFYNDNSFAMDTIVQAFTSEEDLDLWVYDSIDEMFFLADVLNDGLDEQVWVNTSNKLPQLAFIQ